MPDNSPAIRTRTRCGRPFRNQIDSVPSVSVIAIRSTTSWNVLLLLPAVRNEISSVSASVRQIPARYPISIVPRMDPRASGIRNELGSSWQTAARIMHRIRISSTTDSFRTSVRISRFRSFRHMIRITMDRITAARDPP